MWKMFPRLGLFKVIFLLFSVFYLSVILRFFSSFPGDNLTIWSQFVDAFKLATPVATIYIMIVWVVGKWGWLLIWKSPMLGKLLNKSICPNLNGRWVGEVCSNYTDDSGYLVKKKVELNIKADLFGFNILLRSLDDYQSSKVVQSEIYRDPRTNVFYLSYLFEASVLNPKETDDSIFDGACKLEVDLGDNTDILKGTYWTNRCWQQRKNTAGSIKVSRFSG